MSKRLVNGVLVLTIVALGLLCAWLLLVLGSEKPHGRVLDLLYLLIHQPGFVVFVVASLYLVLIVSVRWLLLARPLRAGMSATLAALEASIASLDASDTKKEPVQEFLSDTKKLLVAKAKARERLFWGAYEIEVENRLRYALLMYYDLLPSAEVDVRLLTRAIELERTNASDPFAAVIRKSLKDKSPIEWKRALLIQSSASGLVDPSFNNITTWHRKAFLLIITGLILIVAFAASLGQWQLLLVGAMAAFLSRLWRALNSKTVPLEYWSFWTTLMLAPIAGALAAVGGLLVIELLEDADVLGEALAEINWDDPGNSATLAVAFLLGFSERLLDRLIDRGEKVVLVESATSGGIPGGGSPDGVTVPDGESGTSQSSTVTQSEVAGPTTPEEKTDDTR